MYFCKLNELKQQLRAETVAEGEAFYYFLAVLILDTLLIASWGMVPYESEVGALGYIEMAAYVAIVVAGTLMLFHRNGGKQGKHFFPRYFPLLWVVGIRFLLVCIPLAALYVFFAMSPEEPVDTGKWYETAAYLLVTVVYYWRLYVHIGDVADAERATAAAVPAPTGARSNKRRKAAKPRQPRQARAAAIAAD